MYYFKTALIIILAFILVNNNEVYAQNDNHGERLIKFEQFDKAKAYYLNLLSNDKSGDVFYSLGAIYFKIGNIDSANYYFQNGISLFPNAPMCYVGLVKIKIENNSLGEVNSLINKAISFSNGKNIKMYLELSRAYFETKNKNFEKANEFLLKAKSIDKTSAEVNITQGDLLLAQKKLGEAANSYQNVNYYQPSNTDGLYSYGKIYSLSSNLEISSKAFQEVIAIDSTYIPAYRELGQLYNEFGYYSKAHIYFGKYMNLGEPTIADHIKFASILYFDKDYKNSLVEVKTALEKDPQNAVMKRLLAYNYYESKLYSNSLEAINSFFKSTPENKLISSDFEYNGKILAKNGFDSLAIISFQKSINLDSSKIYLFENIGGCNEKMKKNLDAIHAYETLISLKKSPLSSEYFLLGKNYYIYGMNLVDSLAQNEYLKKADTTFASVISLSPNSYLGYFWRARVNSALDPETSIGLAKQWYEKSITILESNVDKYKKELIEAYQYLGYYYYLKEDFVNSKIYWNKIIAIDPVNAKAIEALQGMK